MAKANARAKNLSGAPRPIGTSEKDATRSPSPLNFKVPMDFRREFKTYAAQHNKKLNELLYEAFAALKAQK
jgi:hypothetical protein